MKRVLIFTDNHFCSNSSIIRQRGKVFSKRLENQIETLNWVEDLAIKEKCDGVICLGDFFDKSVLNDEELTALKSIEWNLLPHYFIVGNHESSVNGLIYNSTKALESSNHFIIDSSSTIIDNDVEICFLPYIIESDRKSINDYFPHQDNVKKRVIFSHNDVKGLQMGPIVSKEGFDINDIEQNCDLFFNGHLHNGTHFSNKCYNLGNVTGQNFGEDATKYSHNVAILDLDTLQTQFIENPHAFNFYKFEIHKEEDFNQLLSLKNNAVVSIKCDEKLMNKCDEFIKHFKGVDYRLITSKDENITTSELDIKDLTIDHLSKFVEFCKERINNDEILEKELNEVCKQ